MSMNQRTVAVSGGFDPLHIGHVRMMEAARALGTRLVVIVNDDDFLMRKKGYIFMKEDERLEIVRSLRCVDEALLAIDKDQTVCETLRAIRPHVFANGGDRVDAKDIPEAQVCSELGIEMVFNVGGGKIQSSSSLVRTGAKKVYD
jgi:D-beta-D-heptose 7-phosphate kinase/D-beta-D-heptose 1-phosphate adenosyltransferase